MHKRKERRRQTKSDLSPRPFFPTLSFSTDDDGDDAGAFLLLLLLLLRSLKWRARLVSDAGSPSSPPHWTEGSIGGAARGGDCLSFFFQHGLMATQSIDRSPPPHPICFFVLLQKKLDKKKTLSIFIGPARPRRGPPPLAPRLPPCGGEVACPLVEPGHGFPGSLGLRRRGGPPAADGRARRGAAVAAAAAADDERRRRRRKLSSSSLERARPPAPRRIPLVFLFHLPSRRRPRGHARVGPCPRGGVPRRGRRGRAQGGRRRRAAAVRAQRRRRRRRRQKRGLESGLHSQIPRGLRGPGRGLERPLAGRLGGWEARAGRGASGIVGARLFLRRGGEARGTGGGDRAGDGGDGEEEEGPPPASATLRFLRRRRRKRLRRRRRGLRRGGQGGPLDERRGRRGGREEGARRRRRRDGSSSSSSSCRRRRRGGSRLSPRLHRLHRGRQGRRGAASLRPQEKGSGRDPSSCFSNNNNSLCGGLGLLRRLGPPRRPEAALGRLRSLAPAPRAAVPLRARPVPKRVHRADGGRGVGVRGGAHERREDGGGGVRGGARGGGPR